MTPKIDLIIESHNNELLTSLITLTSMIIRRLKAMMLAAALLAAPIAMSATKGWETLRSERVDAKSVVRAGEIEIKTAKGVIIITSSHPVQVKVFTILGQLVSSETLSVGTSQLHLGGHGIYIVKAGEITCKVAL